MSPHVLVTGHTGFKGSWLTVFLSHLGYQVSGLSLDPPEEGLFTAANVHRLLSEDLRGDIRDAKFLHSHLENSTYDVVIHLAAQALVLPSYEHPRDTFETNVTGTFNLLEALEASAVDRVVVVTTDKVYKQTGHDDVFSETAPLGGTDPYSSSKTMVEIMAEAWSLRNPNVHCATARAGNVIGGGDFASGRLVPDIVKAIRLGAPLDLRNPTAVRPWQHVLDCINGYIHLVEQIMRPPSESIVTGAWNFGPATEQDATVSDVLTLIAKDWRMPTLGDRRETAPGQEAHYLRLDSTHSRDSLGWTNLLSLDEAVHWTTEWYRRYDAGGDVEAFTHEQVKAFLSRTRSGS